MSVQKRLYFRSLYIAIVLIAFCTCLNGDPLSIPYNITEPDQILQLPKKLEEVSGLSWFDKNTLICHHDEAGNIYFIDIKTGEIKDKKSIDKKGDFEGIEHVDDSIWMILSDGTLYRYSLSKSKKNRIKKFDSKLSVKNDVEGLGFDADSNQLLIACKARPGKNNKDYQGKRAIYRFDINDKKYTSKPLYLIDFKSIHNKMKLNSGQKFSVKMLNLFQSKNEDVIFKPSGIAVHPLSKNIYILSSNLASLVILDQEGDLLDAVLLKSELFRQAEGICFDPSGHLYISNEGKKKGGTILKFNYQDIVKAGKE